MIAVDRMGIQKSIYWKNIQFNLNRLLHQVDNKTIPVILSLLNKNTRKSDLIAKIVTFLPIHIDLLHDKEMLEILQITIKRGLCSERLLQNFFIKKIERRIGKMSIPHLVETIKYMARQKYEV